jgi:hypothetical protein
MPPEVPDEALVMRGGNPHDPRRLEDMEGQARLAYDRGLGYSLSTFAGTDHDLGRDELIRRIAAVHPIRTASSP